MVKEIGTNKHLRVSDIVLLYETYIESHAIQSSEQRDYRDYLRDLCDHIKMSEDLGA